MSGLKFNSHWIVSKFHTIAKLPGNKDLLFQSAGTTSQLNSSQSHSSGPSSSIFLKSQFELPKKIIKLIQLITPALSHDQDFKKGTNKRSMFYWPHCHTDTGKYCHNLKSLGKKMFLTLFSFKKCIFSTLKHPLWLVSLWYYHSCVPSEILTYFDPQHSVVEPK